KEDEPKEPRIIELKGDDRNLDEYDDTLEKESKAPEIILEKEEPSERSL
ncbi:hypothetical protein Tco_1259459, partial [Tanacetum coccineum]